MMVRGRLEGPYIHQWVAAVRRQQEFVFERGIGLVHDGSVIASHRPGVLGSRTGALVDVRGHLVEPQLRVTQPVVVVLPEELL
jgi:hypothetical protein